MSKVIKRGKTKQVRNEADPYIKDFNGHPILILEPEKDEEEHPFGMGARKLGLVLSHLDAVKKFVASKGKDC